MQRMHLMLGPMQRMHLMLGPYAANAPNVRDFRDKTFIILGTGYFAPGEELAPQSVELNVTA